VGLIRAVLLGLRLVAGDEELQEAIRRELRRLPAPAVIVDEARRPCSSIA